MAAADLTLDESKDRAAGVPAPDDLVQLYRRALREFGAVALWSSRSLEHPTVGDALAITETLRVEGTIPAQRLAEDIEQSSHAAV